MCLSNLGRDNFVREKHGLLQFRYLLGPHFTKYFNNNLNLYVNVNLDLNYMYSLLFTTDKKEDTVLYRCDQCRTFLSTKSHLLNHLHKCESNQDDDTTMQTM